GIELASHGIVVLMLRRLLLMLGIGPRASVAAALLFVVYPAQFEALFWVSALPTSLSAALMLVALMMAVRFARGGVGWWSVGVMGAMTFAACCLNEQPASAAGSLPLIAWVACKGGTQRVQSENGDTQRGALGSWIRALAPCGVC